MTDFSSEHKTGDRTILVGLRHGRDRVLDVDESLAELARLVESAGGIVAAQVVQNGRRFHPAHVIGSGKLDEIAELIGTESVNLIVFDEELSPSQIRNIEERLNCKVIDRSVLILAIFARHAHTKESKTQVELAQYEYLYPRLAGQWTHLSKQWGGLGSKGPGETQLEVDRRIIGKRILRLKRDLVKIDKERKVQRKGREGLFKVVMVGYTNAGKSTLFNALTRSEVWAEDRLFCTLDATSRIMATKEGRHILLTDTIGFIRKLPASLFAAFRATLSEVTDADLLMHVIDYSSGSYRQEIEEVESTLRQIEAHKSPRLVVLNKIDLLNGQAVAPYSDSEALAVSATQRVGLDRLVTAITDHAEMAGHSATARRARTAKARIHWENDPSEHSESS